MEAEGPLLCLHEPVTNYYPDLNESRPHFPKLLSNNLLNLYN
jgi:hypothetical protein